MILEDFWRLHSEKPNACIALKSYGHRAADLIILRSDYRGHRSTPRNFVNSKHSKASVRIRFISAATCLAFFAGCATTPQTAVGPQYAPAANTLREARSSQVPVEKRAADYLQVAAITAPLLGAGTQETSAWGTYDAAAVNLPFSFAQPMGADCGIIH